jgi:hypothetical protein
MQVVQTATSVACGTPHRSASVATARSPGARHAFGVTLLSNAAGGANTHSRSSWSEAVPVMARMHAAVLAAAALLLLSLTPGAASGARSLTGTGPSYWADAARFPQHYPAAAAAAEGFVVSPMGGATFCNARLVKPGGGGGVMAAVVSIPRRPCGPLLAARCTTLQCVRTASGSKISAWHNCNF